MSLGPHAAYIWASYAAVTLTIAGLVAGLWLDGRRRRRQLADLEASELHSRRHPGTQAP